jgi:hypothetical protein
VLASLVSENTSHVLQATTVVQVGQTVSEPLQLTPACHNEQRLCEKCRDIARISMQKKQMRERAAKEGQDHSPPIAPTPQDNNIEEECDTELKHKVSGITLSSKRNLTDKSPRKLTQ